MLGTERCASIESAIAEIARSGYPEATSTGFGSRLRRPFNQRHRCLSRPQRVTSSRDSVTAYDGVTFCIEIACYRSTAGHGPAGRSFNIHVRS
jgi:hypothetical protein